MRFELINRVHVSKITWLDCHQADTNLHEVRVMGSSTLHQIHYLERVLREIFLLWPQGNPRLIPLRAPRSLSSSINRDVSSLHNGVLCHSNAGSRNQRLLLGRLSKPVFYNPHIEIDKYINMHACMFCF
jgi:hypothetical protein